MSRRIGALIGSLLATFAVATALVAPAADAVHISAAVPATEAGFTVSSVSRGGLATCAILSTGQLKCWGYNQFGELGQGDTQNRGDDLAEMGDFLPSVDLGVGRKAKAVAVGYYHACAILDNGRVKCWGNNGTGQLGYGDTNDRGDGPNEMGDRLPYVNLGAGRKAKAISAGIYHTCALLDNGSVKCWGDNGDGQLGVGDSNPRGNSPDPANKMGNALPAVNLSRKAKAVVAGGHHTCAILDNNTLKCWGHNLSGQLGIGDNTGPKVRIGDEAGEMSALQPVNLGVGRKVKAVAPGADHTCAVLDNGSVKCWGDNGSSQLGYGDDVKRGDDETVASLGTVDLGTGRKARTITSWGNHTCVTLDNNALKCWGANDHGELGYGDSTPRGDSTADGHKMGDSLLAVDVGPGRAVKAISVGIFHTCAILDNNTLKCWGYNQDGELGLGNANNLGDNESIADVAPVNLGTQVRSFTTSDWHSCAILQNRSVECWGWNHGGALGVGDTNDRGDDTGEMGNNLLKVDLGAGRTAKALSNGQAFSHSCAILDDNTLKCWGLNDRGQLGYDDTVNRGDSTDAGHRMGGDLLAVNLGTGRTAKAVTTGDRHSCALLDDGSVKCWGENAQGELGLGYSGGASDQIGDAPGDMAALQPANLGRKAKAIVAGAFHTCALLDNGSVKCWGNNDWGQLGYGDLNHRGDGPNEMGSNLPTVALGAGRKAKAITAGGFFTCALLDNGTVKCWGQNTYGQLGLGDSFDRGDNSDEMGNDLDAVDLGTGRKAKSIVAGAYHACAILDNGTLKCWGDGSDGALGLGNTAMRGDNADEMGDYLPVVAVGRSRRVLSVNAGYSTTCVLLDDYSLRCWGFNGEGELGRGDKQGVGDDPNEMGNLLKPVSLTG